MHPYVAAFAVSCYTLPAGEVAEWSKARDSKSRRPPKGLEGSNPSLSATVAFELNASA